MSNEIVDKLIFELGSSVETVWNKAFLDAALLLERHSLNRYSDPIYSEMMTCSEICNTKLDEVQYARIIEVLLDFLKNHKDKSASSAWALGKAYRNDIYPILLEALENFSAEGDDEATYQTIIAMENCGGGVEESVFKDISMKSDLVKSSEYAKERLTNE